MPTNKHLLQALKSAIIQFQSDDSQGLKMYEEKIEGRTYRFYGVHAHQQSFEQVREYRAEILKSMRLPTDIPAIQVIGDSARFGASVESKDIDPLDRVGYAREFLFDLLDKHSKHAILYGFTGKAGDVNGLVSEWIDNHPECRARVIGNAVSTHTPMAIDNWGCGYGDIHHLTVVYPNSLFGADVKLSDQFVQQHHNHCGESLGICLEGGIQSFLQVINMLNANIPIFAVEKLRGPANEGCKLGGKYGTFFSASEFFSLIKAESEKARAESRELTREDIEAVRNNYLHAEKIHGPFDIEKHKHLHVFANPERKDYETKISLFTEAFDRFFDLRIWEKLDLLTIVNCEYKLEERARAAVTLTKQADSSSPQPSENMNLTDQQAAIKSYGVTGGLFNPNKSQNTQEPGNHSNPSLRK